MKIIRNGYQINDKYSIKDFINNDLFKVLQLNYDYICLSIMDYNGRGQDVEWNTKDNSNRFNMYQEIFYFINREVIDRLNHNVQFTLFVEYCIYVENKEVN